MATTPFMNLALPTPTVTIGPAWATELNAAIELVDSHDHTPGKGVLITPTAMNINSDLDLKANNLDNANSYRMSNLTSALAGASDIRSIYAVGGELYYNDGNGTSIQITAGGALNASTIGGIGGDYASSTASVFYTSVNSTYTFDQIANRRGNIDVGDVTLRDPAGTSVNGVTLESPTSLGSDYTMTLPTGLSGSALLPMLISNTGAMSIAQIDTAQIADGAITTSKLAAGAKPVLKFTEFTVDGTFNVPTSVSKVIIYGAGGGGGGGGGGTGNAGLSGGGGAGGSGAQPTSQVIDVTPGAAITVTIGAGGAGGASSATGTSQSGGNGSNGTSSTFGTIATFKGGTGGQGGVGNGGSNAPRNNPIIRSGVIAPYGGGGGENGDSSIIANGGTVGAQIFVGGGGGGGGVGDAGNGGTSGEITGSTGGTGAAGGISAGGGGGGGGVISGTRWGGGAGGTGGDGKVIVYYVSTVA